MFKKLSSLFFGALLVLSLTGSVFAEQVKGKITKVENGGRQIVVKAGKKDVKIKISGSRTELEGIMDRSEFKAGQSVTADVEGGEAKKVSVKKKK